MEKTLFANVQQVFESLRYEQRHSFAFAVENRVRVFDERNSITFLA